LGPLLRSIDFKFYHRVEPGSSLFIEVHQETPFENRNFTLDLYYMKDHKDKQFEMSISVEDLELYISQTFEDFHKIFGENQSMESICELPYVNYLSNSENSG
jgi:hypothetical protein